MATRRKDSATVDIKIRMKEPLRRKIEKSAAHRGTSMNAEMVDRIERSFEESDHLDRMQKMLGGRATFGLLMILGRVMHEAGTTMAMASRSKDTEAAVENWHRDPTAYDQAARAVVAVLAALRPPGEPLPTRLGAIPDLNLDLDALYSKVGEGFAASALDAVSSPESAPTSELQEFGKQVRELFAPADQTKGKQS